MEQESWERRVIEKLSLEGLKEQRRSRRWGIFFKFLGFGYLGILIALGLGWVGTRSSMISGRHTALVEISGVIEAKGRASADSVTSALQSAFKDANAQGIILKINSPGGSPVQAGIIYDEIRRLRALHPELPLYAVIEDLCASGGYYVAAAADRIYVDKASLVGSIGVIMDGWGFTGVMSKLGVERRVLTAGENKAFLDPFSPLDPKQKEFALTMLADIHQQFIDVVKKGRGTRLKENPDLFSGLIWTGAKSIELGLADALGSVDSVARDVIKAEDIVDYTERENVAERVAKRIGASLSEGLAHFATQQSVNLR